jgi:hypothetical protein
MKKRGAIFVAPLLDAPKPRIPGFRPSERPPSFAAVLALRVAAVAMAALIAVIAVTAHALVEVERAE